MAKPRLVGTPLSHFTRKIRVLFHELDVDFDFVRARNVLDPSPAAYGDNPLMRVPAMELDGETVFDSEHIARLVVARFDANDRLGVRSERVEDLNRVAVIGGIMSNEVVLILAARAGLEDTENVAYFRKLKGAMEGGLAWLDARVDTEAERFDWGDVATICLWQHLEHYALVPLDRYPRMAARVARFAHRPSIAATTPKASLDEAIAAGWSPG